MNAEVMIFMDTESSGRYFDIRTYNVQPFYTMRGLKRLCETTQYENVCARDAASLRPYPTKGKLASLHVSIYAVDQNGVHGVLHVSPSERVIFRSGDELEALICEESARALKRQRARVSGRCGIPFQNIMERASFC